MDQKTISYAISGVVIAIILYFRVVRGRTARPLNVNLMWITPVVFLAIFSGFIFLMLYGAYVGPQHVTPTGQDIAIMAAVLVAGAAIGWWRGRFMKIEVDPATQKVMVQASGMAIAVLLGLLVIRMGLRFVFMGAADPMSHDGAILNVDFMLFAIGILVVARLEMWIRARRVVAEAGHAPA